MDERAIKLALARKKLKDHQVKKLINSENQEVNYDIPVPSQPELTATALDDTSNLNATNANKHEINMYTTVNDTVNSNKIVDITDVPQNPELGFDVTQILLAQKNNFDLQVLDYQSKLTRCKYDYDVVVNENDTYKQQIQNLEHEIKTLKNKFHAYDVEDQTKIRIINELNSLKLALSDENSNLREQLEFTKSMLTAKESENVSLLNQLQECHNQLEVAQLHLQQLTNGSQTYLSQNNNSDTENRNSEDLLQKVTNLEQQLKSLQKEKEQTNAHYEQYVAELNEQLKVMVGKNESALNEVQTLALRESNLIEQISQMEIRLQNYNKQDYINAQAKNVDTYELQQNYENINVKFNDVCKKYEDLQRKNEENENKIRELKEIMSSQKTSLEVIEEDKTISMVKLNADIASDKVAVQRATEQNKKLKVDLQELEAAFVKISRDKLELTEKLAAEKFLNRELTIKLADIDEKAKDMHVKLYAKDEEMIRLQSNYREAKKQLDKLNDDSLSVLPDDEGKLHNHSNTDLSEENALLSSGVNNECTHHTHSETKEEISIPKGDAMIKLQKRFLKIMEEVADLSDEKHRLEHIIQQLQNETDTICEYVALYQQQRSILKKRDEERSAQIKLFQSECESLKRQLEEVTRIMVKLTKDGELSVYFKDESRHSDVEKIMELLGRLKTNSIIDFNQHSNLNDFYPCNCCSGQLIDV